MRVPDLPMEPQVLEYGDKVYFDSERQGYTVRAVHDRYVILTKPMNALKTVLYTIIDWKRGIRGPDDLVFGMGYEDQWDIDDNMIRLLQGKMEVSSRRCKRLNIVKVKKAPDSYTLPTNPEPHFPCAS